MTGPEKQTITNIRAEFRRLVENRFADPNTTDDEISEGLYLFAQYLESIDIPIDHNVSTLGISVEDKTDIIDKFGG